MHETDPTKAPVISFLTLMDGNRARLWTSIFGALLILLVWQHSYVTLVAPIFVPKSLAFARQEALFATAWLLGGFAPALLVVLLWRRIVEQLWMSTLFTAMPRFRWRLAVSAALMIGALGLALTWAFDAATVDSIKNRASRFSPSDWLLLMGAYGVGICIQATFEEVFVRGWLLQHVTRILPQAFGAIFVTALVFSALHFRQHGWATYVVAFTFGMAFGWSAYRLNGLEAAIGAHIGNNLIGALLAGQMITGNAPSMDANQFIQFALYVLGFLVFVEVWARFFEKPSRA